MKKYLFIALMLSNCAGIYYQEEFEKDFCGASYESSYNSYSFNAGWGSIDDFNDRKCWAKINKQYERK